MKQKRYPTSLTIAGSDSGGGAGIQADIKTFSSLGVYSTSVITAITAQNTLKVTDIHPIPFEIVSSQLDAVLSDIKVDSFKLGMMFSSSIIDAVSEKLIQYSSSNIIIDPVLKSTTGSELTKDEIIESYINKLFPISTILTPNKNEAEVITGISIDSEDDIIKSGKIMIDMGCKSVLIKGGHFDGEYSTDYYITNKNEIRKFSSRRIKTINDHGTGCSLSSAIAAYIALGYENDSAIEKAKEYISKAIFHGKDYITGQGHGPLNHFFSPEILI